MTVQYNFFSNSRLNYELWVNVANNVNPLDARHNWWGTNIDSEISERIWEHEDDNSKLPANIVPFLETSIELSKSIFF